MSRYTAAPALLVVLLTAACSGTDTSEDPTSPDASSRPRSNSSSAHNPDAAAQRKFDLPAGAKVLVPKTKGSGDADLPGFKPETDAYTIYVTCTGKGKMTIVNRNAPKDGPTKINCNGPITIGRVYTDIVAQELSVHVKDGNANWELAVVSGEHAA
ncbi:hypothetical protein [Streptomyces sp. NPDC002952]|uniref:hypothetical protein n=1 Tax=Streptomyces sp. NPDC002952 TaxID=3364673 RepID=UPI0036B0918C